MADDRTSVVAEAGGWERSAPRPGQARMPVTGFFIGIYLVSLVLFSQSAATSRVTSVLGYLLALVFIVELIRSRGRLVFPGALVWFLVFICFCVFQMIFVPGSIAMLLTLVQLFVLSAITVRYITTDQSMHAIEYALYFAVACTFVYNIVAKPPLEDGRLGSTLLNANGYSFVLMLGALFALRALLHITPEFKRRRKALLFYVLYLALSVYGVVVLTKSRKGIMLITICSVVLVIYWVWRQPISRRMLISVVLVLVFGALGYALFRSSEFSRIVDLTNTFGGGEVVDTGLVKRVSYFKGAIDLWLQRPFTGWGLDQFRVVSGSGTYSHDNYVELLANQGIVGLLAYLMIYVTAFVSLARSLMVVREPWLSVEVFWALVVLGMLVAWDVGAVSYYDKLNWVVLSIVIAISVVARAKTRAGARTPGPLLP